MRKITFGSFLKNVSPLEKRIDIEVDDFLKKASFRPEIVRGFMEQECDGVNKREKQKEKIQ